MPSDERGLYIKVYMDDLRDLVQTSHLTPSEIGALLILALRINSDNQCHPSRARLAADIGVKSVRGISKIHNQLRAKKVLHWVHDPDKRTNTYTIPLCFSFGSDRGTNVPLSRNESSYSRNKSTQGDRNESTYISRNESTYTPRNKSTYKQESEEQDPINKTQTEQQKTGQPFGLALKKGDPGDQLLLTRQLLDIGVGDKEAYYIPQQYSPELIQETIQEASQKKLKNRGAWIRSVIERKEGKTIDYSTAQHSLNSKSNHGEREKNHNGPPEWAVGCRAARSIDPELVPQIEVNHGDNQRRYGPNGEESYLI